MTNSASFKMTLKDQSIGYKITKLRDGGALLTARDLTGKMKTKHRNGRFMSVILPEGTEMTRQKFSVPIGGTRYTITAIPGRPGDKILLSFSSDMPGLSIDPMMVGGPGGRTSGPDPIDSGLWSWAVNAVKDVASAIGAGSAVATGGEGEFPLSGGGKIEVLREVSGGEYGVFIRGSDTGFKAEDGLEEDPNIWY